MDYSLWASLEGGHVINLLPWREWLFLKRKIFALSMVIIGYLLLFTVSGILFSNTYDKKNEEMYSVRQLQQEVDQLHLHSKKIFEKEVTQKQLLAMSAVVWKRYYFIEKTIQLIIRIPNAIRLIKLYCVKETCHMELHIENPVGFRSIFSNYKVQDVKQESCALCYQAEVTAPL